MGQNADRGGGNSYFQISGQSLVKENYHNSRTSDDIGMKPNFMRQIRKRQKKLMMTSYWQIVTPLPFFQFMVNPEAKFQTHSLTKTESRTKKPLTQLSYYALSRGTTFAKKMLFFPNK